MSAGIVKTMRLWNMMSNVRGIRTSNVRGIGFRTPLWHSKIATVTGISAVLGVMNGQLNSDGSRQYNSSYTVPKPPPNTSAENIVWVDMEMTGLDPDKDHVLEVACLVTDGNLNVLAEGPDLCIRQPPEVMAAMNEWSANQHGESGLTSKCQTDGVPLREAERQLVDFVRQWAPFKKCPLGGNTVYMDRIFLMKYMPEFEQHMHYRIIDVSSVKEICRRWYADGLCNFFQGSEPPTHRAMDDIKASVEMLKYFRRKIFRPPYHQTMNQYRTYPQNNSYAPNNDIYSQNYLYPQNNS